MARKFLVAAVSYPHAAVTHYAGKDDSRQVRVDPYLHTIVFGDDVHRGAEPGGQLERVTSAELKVPARVDAGPMRIDVREGRLRGHAAQKDTCPPPVAPGRPRRRLKMGS